MDLSWGTLITDTYDVLWKMIIRPPRARYSLSDLGHSKFRLGDRVFVRRDIQLVNERNMKLECSHFTPADQGAKTLPVCVYLHGNCSSRLEAADALKVLLPLNVTVFCLDLSGSGKSEGEYISLGHYEERDLRVVLEHLRAKSSVSAVGIWGRSMGAATSIQRAAEDWAIDGCVLDSPFSSLRLVAEELVNSGVVSVPTFLVDMALSKVRGEIQKRAGFDIEELRPIQRAPLARAPVLFGVARDDDFVRPHHTEKLYEAWGGKERKLIVFNGGHNGARPQWFMEQAAQFLATKLGAARAGERARTAPKEAVPSPGPWDDDGSMSIPPRPPSPSPAPRPDAVPASSQATKLLAMGFSSDMVAEALKKNKTTEAAIEWILEESTCIMRGSAEALGTVQMCAPSTSEGHPSTFVGLGAAEPDDASSRRSSKASVMSGSGTPAPSTGLPSLRSHAGTSGRSSGRLASRAAPVAPHVLLAHLVELGFTMVQANRAVENKCISVEQAVEWFASHGEM